MSTSFLLFVCLFFFFTKAYNVTGYTLICILRQLCATFTSNIDWQSRIIVLSWISFVAIKIRAITRRGTHRTDRDEQKKNNLSIVKDLSKSSLAIFDLESIRFCTKWDAAQKKMHIVSCINNIFFRLIACRAFDYDVDDDEFTNCQSSRKGHRSNGDTRLFERRISSCSNF